MLLAIAQKNIQDDIKRIVSSKNQFYQLLSDKVNDKNSQIIETAKDKQIEEKDIYGRKIKGDSYLS